jgi:hypothetical protein
MCLILCIDYRVFVSLVDFLLCISNSALVRFCVAFNLYVDIISRRVGFSSIRRAWLCVFLMRVLFLINELSHMIFDDMIKNL